MSPGATFERVYVGLKTRLRAGEFSPGERLEPASLSDDLAASVTPVRDALHRLVGERLVEAPKNDGFRVPNLTEMGLRHLYACHLDLLLMVLGSRVTRRIAPEDGFWQYERLREANTRADGAHFFAHLGGAGGNPEHGAAIASLADRLAPARALENAFVADAEAELAAMMTMLSARALPRLREALTRYHRRRERLVPQLLAALQKRD